VERGKAICRMDRKHYVATEKINEFSLPETIRDVNAVKIMNFPSFKCFLIFTALFIVLFESFAGLSTRKPELKKNCIQ